MSDQSAETVMRAFLRTYTRSQLWIEETFWMGETDEEAT
jgi:hypothetical protein